ncbi:MAG: hypothetical protein DMG83_22755, partial [Acidobacteria bacterium]
MDSTQSDLQALRELVRDLAHRVEQIERKLDLDSAIPAAFPPPVEPVRAATPSLPVRKTSERFQPTAAPPPPAPLPPIPSTPATASPEQEIDLESRIGSHWLNRIGIAAVLIGVSYFLKYA